MRLLVTGGAGFIGSCFVRKFLKGEFPEINSITVLDKLTYAGNVNNYLNDDKIHFILGDICNSELITSIVDNFDAVINFAAESHVDRSINDSHSFVSTNVLGTNVLLEAILNSKKQPRFLQISTDEVYGSIIDGYTSESSEISPNSPYAASKAAADLLVLSFFKTHNLDVVITRSCNNYGPFQFPEKLVPVAIQSIFRDKPVPLYGNGKNIRNWIHVEDNCDGIYLALLRGESGHIYNIGSDVLVSNEELSKNLLRIMGKEGDLINYIDDRKGHDFRYALNWRKAKNELDFEPKIDFLVGLKHTVNWYLENQKWVLMSLDQIDNNLNQMKFANIHE